METPCALAQSVPAVMPQGFWANYYRKKMRVYPREGAGVKLDRVQWVEAGGSHAQGRRSWGGEGEEGK